MKGFLREKIRPCPFCGGVPRLVFEKRSFEYAPDLNYVICTGCGARGPVYHSNLIDESKRQKQAITAWDRRVK